MNGKTYPAITLHQPWASLVASGYKLLLRTSNQDFGELVGQTVAIHASECYTKGLITILKKDYPDVPIDRLSCPSCCVLCLVDVFTFSPVNKNHNGMALEDCGGDWGIPLFGLFFKNIRPFLKPIPCDWDDGMIWFWTAPEEPLFDFLEKKI